MSSRTISLLVALALLTLACGGGVLAARNNALDLFVTGGATDVQIEWRTVNQAVVRYHALGQPFGWRGELSEQLDNAGWRGRSFTNMGVRRPPFATIFFTRRTVIGPLALEERAVFGNHAEDPFLASVEVTREVRWR